MASPDDDVVNHGHQNELEPEEGTKIKFNPPMSIQRYKKVSMYLNKKEFKHKFNKLVDFGCSDMNFLKFAKRVSGIRDIAVVDVDENVLRRFIDRAAPLATDYIFRRSSPLTVTIYKGDLTVHDDRLRCYDVVTAIELIEHLHPEVLDKVPEALFGFVRPKVALLTTPNADFNVLFASNKKFRHWDHKFEWTRKEFHDWCDAVISKYPAYSCSMRGIGDGPSGSESLGRCSQMAVFSLIDETYRDDPLWLNNINSSDTCKEPYLQIELYVHPHKVKATPEMMLSNLLYYVRLLGQGNHEVNDSDDDNDDDRPLDIAITDLLSIPKLKSIFKSEESIRKLLSSPVGDVCNKECVFVSKDGRYFIRYNRLKETSSDNESDDEDDGRPVESVFA